MRRRIVFAASLVALAALPVPAAYGAARLRVVEAQLSNLGSAGPTLAFVVRNVGDRRAPRATVRVYLSDDARYSVDDRRVITMSLPRIAPRRQAERVTNWDWGDSERYALVCVTARGLRRHCRAAR